MVTKRRPIRSVPQNFRPGGPETSRAEAKGTRPTANPSSITEVLMKALLHLCKKTIFFDTNLKVALYLGSLFLISLFGDFVPFPKSYFSRSDNLFNQYFVKIGWGWTLLVSVPFLFLVHFTLCCGDAKKVVRSHLPRILIATGFWFTWTKLFNMIEISYGRCTVRDFDTKSSCIKGGHFWNGFDISGHSFILIYSSLILIEEARPIINWDSLKDYIRNELHNRSVQEYSSSSPLRNLSDGDLSELKYLYERFTPYIRGLFIGITSLQLLWDIMLVCTMMYFHNMAEKVLSGIFAILTWFFTYRIWYQSTQIMPELPGKCNFLYQKEKNGINPGMKRKQSLSLPKRFNLNNTTTQPNADPQTIPTFPGMAGYGTYKPKPPKDGEFVMQS